VIGNKSETIKKKKKKEEREIVHNKETAEDGSFGGEGEGRESYLDSQKKKTVTLPYHRALKDVGWKSPLCLTINRRNEKKSQT